MTVMIRMHELAMARGDGLRPELLALLRRRAAIETDPAVTELAPLRGERCSGPLPTGTIARSSAPGIPLFPIRTAIPNEERQSRKGRRCT